MTVEELKDGDGRVIGRIQQNASGRWELRDAGGRLKGRYDPTTDETRDAAGILVGGGNLLPTLLPRS
jgi:hypothetical protein